MGSSCISSGNLRALLALSVADMLSQQAIPGGTMTFPNPRPPLKPNTADFERLPLVKPTGFREYDARWLFSQDINLMGLQAVGLGMATLFAERGVPKRLVVGHDYRSYSASVKQALITGLLAGGCEVHDIGLALSPMAYFA